MSKQVLIARHGRNVRSRRRHSSRGLTSRSTPLQTNSNLSLWSRGLNWVKNNTVGNGNIAYVNFPDDLIQVSEDGTRMPLGHAGVLIYGDDGKTEYYEYGRGYNGTGKHGGWRKVDVEPIGNRSTSLYAEYLNKKFGGNGGRVEISANRGNIDATRNFILADMNNKNRPSYNVVTNRTCAGMARAAWEAGANPIAKQVDKKVHYTGRTSTQNAPKTFRNGFGAATSNSDGIFDNLPSKLLKRTGVIGEAIYSLFN